MAARAISDAEIDDTYDDDDTYIAEFFNFNGDIIGSFEIKYSTTFVVYPASPYYNRYFEMRELPDKSRLDGVSNNFYECDEPLEDEETTSEGEIPTSLMDLLDDTSPQGWRLWLDSHYDDPLYPDNKVPSGFLGAKSSKEAMDLVKEHGMPIVMDLDFELGPNDTAEEFLKDLVCILEFPLPPPPIVNIHTTNMIGRQWLLDYIETWRKATSNPAF